MELGREHETAIVVGCAGSIPGIRGGTKIKPGLRYFCYDKKPWDGIARLQRYQSNRSLPPERQEQFTRVEFAKDGDILNVEFKPGSVREFHACNFFESDKEIYPHTRHLLEKFAKALKPGGTIFVTHTLPTPEAYGPFEEIVKKISRQFGLEPQKVTDRQEAIDIAGDLHGQLAFSSGSGWIIKLMKPEGTQQPSLRSTGKK